MYSNDMNKQLWRNDDLFDQFLEAVNLFRQSVSKNPIVAQEVLSATNIMDDVMQLHESQYGPINDPIFFWWFATANTLFLQAGKAFDEIGAARIGYIVNGYKEALNKHSQFPSLPSDMLKIAFEHMDQFASESDKTWLVSNRSRFKPFLE